MTSKTNELFKEISRLIFSVESSRIDKISKLKITKVLLALKLSILELLKSEIRSEGKAIDAARIKAPGNGHGGRDIRKHELILEFIKNNGGKVSLGQLSGLGIAGRSLRRYMNYLRNQNKIRIERAGRNLFYLMV